MREESNRQRLYDIGLALSGGSAKGFAHIGVLQYLEEKGLRPDIMAGTSVGALIAALYCDGYSPLEILDLFDGAGFKKMTDWQIPQAGFFGTTGFKSFLRSAFRHKRIQDLDYPLYLVATDLDKGRSKYFTRGPLVEVVTASCSIPVLFNPVRIDGTYYVDGGLFKNLPASVIRQQCKSLIGIHLDPQNPAIYKKNLLAIAERSFSYIFRANSLADRELCDVLIESHELAAIGRFDVKKSREIAQLGYNLARATLEGLSRKELVDVSVSTPHPQIQSAGE